MPRRTNDFNLNDWGGIPIDGTDEEMAEMQRWVEERKQPVHGNSVTVYFDNIEAAICEEIAAADIVIGCVAWLTNAKILEAMAQKERVGIAIQKEDFLRPDSGSWTAKRLQQLYAALPEGPLPGSFGEIHDWGGLLPLMAFGQERMLAPVRWAGEFNKGKEVAFPRMHNKFIVLARFSKDAFLEKDYGEYIPVPVEPYRVLTGSFNFTHNSSRSMENIVVIDDPKIVQAYYREWQRIYLTVENIPDYAWKKAEGWHPYYDDEEMRDWPGCSWS